MHNLFIIHENLTNGYNTEVLDIISLLAILFGILVIISKNPITSILFLIGLFGSISSYLILLGVTFIGLSYLIVYIGAVSILFLFILMLINIRISELQSNTNNSIPLALFIIIFLNYTLFKILPYDVAIINNKNDFIRNFFYDKLLNINPYKENNFKEIHDNSLLFSTSNAWDISLAETNNISSIGNLLYTSHNIWLFIASYILLLAMVGAIIITIKRNKE